MYLLAALADSLCYLFPDSKRLTKDSIEPYDILKKNILKYIFISCNKSLITYVCLSYFSSPSMDNFFKLEFY